MNDYIGMAKPHKGHQRLIADLLKTINEQLNEPYIPLPECNLDDTDQYSKQPDVSIIDEDNERIILTIELSSKQKVKADITKMQAYMLELDITEGFVIEYLPEGYASYIIKNWYRITPEHVYEDESYSELLEIELNNL